jgi:hypothetical protein
MANINADAVQAGLQKRQSRLPVFYLASEECSDRFGLEHFLPEREMSELLITEQCLALAVSVSEIS